MRNAFFSSLRFRLLFWYMASLLFLGAFIILTIHILQYKYSVELIVVLFLGLSATGFAVLYRITRSLTELSSQIGQISTKTLDTRIKRTGEDEIGLLADAFNHLLTRIEKAFKRDRQFIADVAHEMKTPIATLRSSFEVTLQKERSNEEYKKIIRDSIAETDRMTATLKDVLDLAWSEVPNETLRQRFDLSELVHEIVEIAQKLSIKKQISVSASITPNVEMVGFRDRLGRALLNIVDNAVKYTHANGKIDISLVKEQTNALITVHDNGQGIDSADRERIFDRFYRGGKTDKVFGAGLGLAIAKSIVHMHKGSIRVDSKPKHGATFIVVFPLT